MIRLQQRKNSRKGKATYILVGIALVLFIVFQLGGLPHFLSSITTKIASPLWNGREYASSHTGAASFSLQSKRSLTQRISELEEELRALRIRSLTRELLLQENKELKDLLGRTYTERESVLGVVLVKPSQTLYDTFIIDLGSDDEITEGMRVVAYEDVTIGFVEEVFKDTSLVKLYSSPGEVTSVSVGEDNISARAEGRGNGNFIMTLPQGAEVALGDIVSLPSISTRVIGVVELIETTAQDSFKTIYFKSPINMHELKWVQVITG